MIPMHGRYAKGKTLAQLGADRGVSREAIRLREKAALDELRKHKNKLSPFLYL